MYIHTYIHTHVHTYARTYIQREGCSTYILYAHWLTGSICTYIRTYIRTYVRTHARTHVHTYKKDFHPVVGTRPPSYAFFRHPSGTRPLKCTRERIPWKYRPHPSRSVLTDERQRSAQTRGAWRAGSLRPFRRGLDKNKQTRTRTHTRNRHRHKQRHCHRPGGRSFPCGGHGNPNSDIWVYV